MKKDQSIKQQADRKAKADRLDDENDTSLLEEILDFVKFFAICAIAILLFINFIAKPVTVVSHSMDPNLADGEVGFTGIIQNMFRANERGDIVVVKMKDDNGNDSHWVKRIIGLPGETIEATGGTVYINGQPLDESAYLNQEFMQTELNEINAAMKDSNTGQSFQYGTFQDDFGPVTLGADEYFVMGDNRPKSKDSRYSSVGPVTKEQIVGTGMLVIYPFNQFGIK